MSPRVDLALCYVAGKSLELVTNTEVGASLFMGVSPVQLVDVHVKVDAIGQRIDKAKRHTEKNARHHCFE